MAVTDELPVNPSFVVPVKMTHKVLVSEFDSGQEQRKLKWNNPKRSWRLRTEAMTAAELESLRDFWLARKGPFDVFSFLPPFNLDRLIKNVPCGTGNGSTTVFYIQNSQTPPFYYRLFTGTGHRNKVYKDSVEQVSGFTLANDDTNKRSTITFTVAPANAVVITADVDRYMICRFATEEFSVQLEHFNIGSGEYELVEVLRSSI